MRKKISIIIPVYYNELSLPTLFSRLTSLETQLQELQVDLELIFVDDGSKDNSLLALLDIKQKRQSTKIIELTRNFGAIHALKTGLQFVTGDGFIFLSADLQDPPELITEMIRRWLTGEKFIISVREERDDQWGSKLFSALYYFLLRAIVDKNYPQGGYDLALMDKTFLPYLLNSGKNINLALFSYWLGFKPSVIHYVRQKRQHGKSRWTFAKKFNYFLDSLLGFSIIPIRFISFLGFLVSSLSFAYGFFVIISTLFGEVEVRGFPATVTIISFLLGIVIIMLGIIGEYVWRIFDEINRRPETVIKEIH